MSTRPAEPHIQTVQRGMEDRMIGGKMRKKDCIHPSEYVALKASVTHGSHAFCKHCRQALMTVFRDWKPVYVSAEQLREAQRAGRAA